MSVTYPDRAVIRKAIAALLTTALTGKATVVDYLVIDPAGRVPLVFVASASSSPDEVFDTYAGMVNVAGFNVGVMVAYSSGAWTPALCEDKSDELSRLILQTIANNETTPPLWTRLYVPQPSEPRNEAIGGNRYRIELIPVAALVATSNDG